MEVNDFSPAVNNLLTENILLCDNVFSSLRHSPSKTTKLFYIFATCKTRYLKFCSE